MSKTWECQTCKATFEDGDITNHRMSHHDPIMVVAIVEDRAELMAVDELPAYGLAEHVDEFDYVDEVDRGSPRLFAHNGNVYDTGDMMAADPALTGWDAVHVDSFFSAILVKFLGWDGDDPESDISDEGFVRVGLALS